MRNRMITMEDFIAEDHPILRLEAEEVTFPLSDEDKELMLNMREFLINSQDEEIAEKYNLRAGVGVAAPQLGISKQIFAVYIQDFNEEGEATELILDEILINPQIISHSVQQSALREGEGCLSVRRPVPGLVPRPTRVKVKYYNIEGQEKTLRLRDYEAMVVQHEIDHLKGIMFYDHINEDAPWYQADDLNLI